MRAETIILLGNVKQFKTIVALDPVAAPNFESSNVRL